MVITGPYDYWVGILGMSHVCITAEEKNMRSHILKVTGLLENTFISEIKPLINEMNGRCAIIPERRIRNGSIRKDNVAYVITVPEEDYHKDIEELIIGGRTLYIMPCEQQHCLLCGNPDHQNFQCNNRNASIRDVKNQQYLKKDKDEPITQDMRLFLSNNTQRP